MKLPLAQRLNRTQRACFFLLLVALVASSIKAPWPQELFLQHILTILSLAGLVYTFRKYALSNSSFILITLFLLLHILAARYLYSNVPYDRWSLALFGCQVSNLMGWQRNHFDRLVHLAYGLCLILPLYEALQKPLPARWALQVAVLLIMTSSLLYEWFEWWIALTLSPESAEAYNGQQGDIWDAHKDMLLATLGALASAGWIRFRTRPSL